MDNGGGMSMPFINTESDSGHYVDPNQLQITTRGEEVYHDQEEGRRRGDGGEYSMNGSSSMHRSESAQLVMTLVGGPQNGRQLDEVGASETSRDDDEKTRKDLRRERNREHARISRERKRRKVESLTDENDSLQKERVAVMDECCRLRDALARSENENARLRAWIEQARYAAQQQAAAAASEPNNPTHPVNIQQQDQSQDSATATHRPTPAYQDQDHTKHQDDDFIFQQQEKANRHFASSADYNQYYRTTTPLPLSGPDEAHQSPPPVSYPPTS